MSKRPDNFDYQRYLASREWAVLREKMRERERAAIAEWVKLPKHQGGIEV